MTSLAQYFGDYLSNRYGNNPAFPRPPSNVSAGLGREGLMYLAQSLMTSPTLMGGLSGGFTGASKIYQSGMSGYAEALRKQQDQEAQMRMMDIQARAAEQDMGLDLKRDARAEEQLGLEKERLGLQKLNYEQDLAEWGLRKKEGEARLGKMEREKKEEESKLTAAMFAANKFGKSPEEKALYMSMAQAGEFDGLWSTIKQRSFPDPYKEHWSMPTNKPGIGMVQQNQYGEIRVLNHEDQERKDKDITPTISPRQISLDSVSILTRELIPKWNKEKDKAREKMGWIDRLRGAEPEPTEPMMEFGGMEIPSRLVEESENEAIRRYVNTVQKTQALLKPKGKVSSVSTLPAEGQPIKDFSSKLALDKAIKDKISKDPRYLQMSDEQKKQLADQIFNEIKGQVESGQGTYEQSIKLFLAPQQQY